MKKCVLVVFLLFSPFFYGQISFLGDSKYELLIEGYVSEDSDACGNIYGLREITATYQNGNVISIWSGRKYNESFTHTVIYSKNNPIVSLGIREINRYKTFFGCNGGPTTINTAVTNITTCYSRSNSNLGNQLQNVLIESRPVTSINTSAPPLYLSEKEILKLELPANIKDSDFNWVFKVGNNPEESIPSMFNNKPTLELLGEDFLTAADYGKTVSVWVKTDCYTKNAYSGSSSNNTSNLVRFTYLKDAPHIVSVEKENISCFDEKDGSVKINFARSLERGEKLSILIVDLDDQIDVQGGIPVYNTIESVPNLQSLGIDNSFTFNSIIDKGLPKGNFRVELFGKYFTSTLYIGGVNHKKNFTIDKPTPVEFNTTQVNTWCNGGSDGEIHITAEGGVPETVTSAFYRYKIIDTNPAINGDLSQDWTSFSGATEHTIIGLPKDTYKILVQDSNDCIAKEIRRDSGGQVIGLGPIIEKEVIITEPDDPVAVSFPYHKEPTAFGFSDGRIRAQVTGGTTLPDGSYNYIWTHENGTTWTTFTTITNAEGWFLTLENAISGTYKLTITDASYAAATTKAGCTIVEAEFTLDEPKALEVTLEVYQEISCNQSNLYGDELDIAPLDGQRDESQDGALIAIVSGGVQFSSGLPYRYTWKKRLSNGTWETLTNKTTSIANELSDGNYAFNVEDANGVIIGTYVNNILVAANDVEFYLYEPTKLELTMESKPVTCDSGANGEVKAMVTGGTAPYSYQWSNGVSGSSNELTAIPFGNYTVYVTDSKGCQVRGSIKVDQPTSLTIDSTVINPTCFDGSDGSIELAISGGVSPYIFSWSTGAITQNVSTLSAGDYSVSITDAQGCISVKDITLTNPEQFVIDLGEDRTLCNEQSHYLDATIDDLNATYLWSSDTSFSATSPKLTITEPGTYTVTATSILGCVVTDTITITTTNTVIDAEFLLPSQAYLNEDVMLFNISKPLGETSTWVIPEEVTILNQEGTTISLQFSKTGTYKIGLITTEGDCYKEHYKNIVVEEPIGLPNPGDAKSPFIEKFELSINPNQGQFNVAIRLEKNSPIALRFFDTQGQLLHDMKSIPSAKLYDLPLDLNLSTGTYLIVLETAKETQVKRMIIF